MKKPKNLIAKTYKKYTKIARDMVKPYAETFGYYCDLYFPIRVQKKDGHSYQKTNLFEPHELPVYKPCPDGKDYVFYIPNLIKKESMNSVANQFDNFVLQTQGMSEKPFIECNPDDELPDYTKIVIKMEGSELFYFVDIKHVVNGAGGHMLMRQYLSPLTKDNHLVDGKYEGIIPGTKGTTNGVNSNTDGRRGGLLD